MTMKKSYINPQTKTIASFIESAPLMASDRGIGGTATQDGTTVDNFNDLGEAGAGIEADGKGYTLWDE